MATGELIRAVTILVVFCPCALVLATPTAVMAAIGNATRHGFLVREGDALERLSCVSYLTFDKTGTLTAGRPALVEACWNAPGEARQWLLRVAALEKASEHPIAGALLAAVGEVRVFAVELRAATGKMLGHGGDRVVAQRGALKTANVGGAEGAGELDVFAEGLQLT